MVLVLFLDKVVMFPKGRQWEYISVDVGQKLETVGDYKRGRDIKTVKFLQYVYRWSHTLENSD